MEISAVDTRRFFFKGGDGVHSLPGDNSRVVANVVFGGEDRLSLIPRVKTFQYLSLVARGETKATFFYCCSKDAGKSRGVSCSLACFRLRCASMHRTCNSERMKPRASDLQRPMSIGCWTRDRKRVIPWRKYTLVHRRNRDGDRDTRRGRGKGHHAFKATIVVHRSTAAVPCNCFTCCRTPDVVAHRRRSYRYPTTMFQGRYV